MAVLEPSDCAVRQVCKTWRTAWDATKEQRRKLRSDDTYMSPDFPLEAFAHMAPFPDGQRMLIASDSGTRIVDKNLHTLQLLDEIGDPGDICGAAAGADSIYVCIDNSGEQGDNSTSNDGRVRNVVQSFTLTPVTVAAEYSGTSSTEYFRNCMVADDLLMVAVYNSTTSDYLTMRALDGFSLDERFSFGSDLEGVASLAAGGGAGSGELFVATKRRGTVLVYSYAGEKLRTIQGDWYTPWHICLARGRLYINEDFNDPEVDAAASGKQPAAGRRIFVVDAATARTLQVHDTLESRIWDMSAVGDRLLVFCYSWTPNSRAPIYGSMQLPKALKGL